MEKGVLYLGIDPTHFRTTKRVLHMPLLRIVRRPVDSKELHDIFSHIPEYTHLIFTSKSAVRIFFSYYKAHGHRVEELLGKHVIAIGHVTAYYLKEEGIIPGYIASEETEEGLVRVLSTLELHDAYVLLPKSSLPKTQLSHFLVEHGVRHRTCVLYDALEVLPTEPVNLEEIEEVVFTNSMTVEGFFSLYPKIPSWIKLHPLGTVTREALRTKLKEIQDDDAVRIAEVALRL